MVAISPSLQLISALLGCTLMPLIRSQAMIKGSPSGRVTITGARLANGRESKIAKLPTTQARPLMTSRIPRIRGMKPDLNARVT
jgi:hypothetical protein